MQPRSLNRSHQVIYLMQIVDAPELLKIGRSRDPWKRKKELEKYYRNKLILVYKSNPHFLADKIEANILARLKWFQVPGLGEREIIKIDIDSAIKIIQEEFKRMGDKPLQIEKVYKKPPKMKPRTSRNMLPPDAWPNAVGMKRPRRFKNRGFIDV